MNQLDVTLNEDLPKLAAMLSAAGYCIQDISEIKKLFAGLFVLTYFVVDENSFNRDQVNKALRLHLGSGHSWYSSLKFLTGERAKTIFTNRSDVIREIGGSELIRAFNVILPQARNVIDLL